MGMGVCWHGWEEDMNYHRLPTILHQEMAHNGGNGVGPTYQILCGMGEIRDPRIIFKLDLLSLLCR
jgi:hypothetical protein